MQSNKDEKDKKEKDFYIRLILNIGYYFEVLPGRIIFEVDGVEESIAREALRKAGTKLPIKTRIIARNHK
jgi:hypothetical protein